MEDSERRGERGRHKKQEKVNGKDRQREREAERKIVKIGIIKKR